MEELLATIRAVFVKAFQPFLTGFVASIHAARTSTTLNSSVVSWNFAKTFANWDKMFDEILHKLESNAARVSRFRIILL